MKIKSLILHTFICILIVFANITIANAESSGLLLYYDFENIITNDDGTFVIKDLSGNGYDGIPVQSTDFREYRLLDEISGRGKAFCGTIKLNNECFENIDSDYTINFIGSNFRSTSQPLSIIKLGLARYTSDWGSGMVRAASYYENRLEYMAFCRYDPINDYNMYTFMSKNGELKMYLNGVEITDKFQKGTLQYTISEMAQNPENEFIVQKYYLDEFRVYNRALSDEEIKELLNNEIVVEISNAYWKNNQATAKVKLNTFLSPSYGYDFTPACSCILAAYDKNDKLIGTSTYEMTDGTYIGELQIECREKPAYLKLFVWDSLSGMKPQFDYFKYQQKVYL